MATYSSTKELNFNHEYTESNVGYIEARAAMDALLERLTALRMEEGYPGVLILPNARCRVPRCGGDYPLQTLHKNFKHIINERPRYSISRRGVPDRS